MKYSTPRRLAAQLLICLPISLSCVLLYSTPLAAQSLDTEPPKITFDTVEEARKGDSQVFTVTATDNVGIESLDIFYRTNPERQYTIASMSKVGSTDLYSFTLRASAISGSVDVIQYYIEAKDAEGNRTLQGFSFDPLERVLLERPAATVADVAQPDTESTSLIGSLSTTQKILYGVLGVVVVGALVSAANSGGDDGGSSSATGVPLTITVAPLNITP